VDLQWRYCRFKNNSLSDEQEAALNGIVCQKFSTPTGGFRCCKTNTTLVIVKLLEAMKQEVMLAALTGGAAQRMTEVIGKEAKTIHRLLEWQSGKFKKDEDDPFDLDFLIDDECSMLDISLTELLLKAVACIKIDNALTYWL